MNYDGEPMPSAWDVFRGMVVLLALPVVGVVALFVALKVLT